MRKILIIFLFVLLCGCEKKQITKTIIEEANDYVISINYPITNVKKIDNKIKQYVNNYYHNFNKNKIDDIKELNISYTYNHFNNRYINIVIDVYKYDGKYANDSLIINYDEEDECFVDTISESEIKTSNEVKINNQEKIKAYGKKIIALTFDDGPSYYTKSILKTLNEYKINATFFVIGNKVKQYKETLKEIVLSGNEIGNHTYSHKLLSRLSKEEYLAEINKTQELLKQYVGYTPVLFRPSYGSIKKDYKNITELDIILWNIDTLDWKYKSYKTIARRAINKAKDMGIILMHDTYKRSDKALKIIIKTLLDEGYEFVTISELEKIKILRNLK